MELTYNDVEFKLLSLDQVQRRLVYSSDGSSVLWVEWNILASCVYAPSTDTTTGDLGGTAVGTTRLAAGSHQLDGPLTTPVGEGRQGPKIGNNPRPRTVYQGPSYETPIYTDQEVLERLAIPRRPLIITARDSSGNLIEWLVSPRPGFTSDCNNGPVVKASPVVQASGQAQAFGVQLEITTYAPASEQDRLVLCHRWQMGFERSEADYLTRTVTGEVVFHTGMLEKHKLNPSWFILQFFHPIPQGFRRFLGPITLSPNGAVLRYEYHDEDQTVVFSPGNSGCTEVEVVVNTGFTSPLIANAVGA